MTVNELIAVAKTAVDFSGVSLVLLGIIAVYAYATLRKAFGK